MAKRIYDDESELFTDLEEELSNSMLTSVDKIVKKIYKRNTEKMYNSYSPTSYKRRYDNKGFGDESNLESRVDEMGESFEYIMTNETLANGDNKRDRLDSYIEEGQYKWRKKPGKRPVYKWTQEEIDSTNEVENAIYRDLKSWL
ncbi:hypothetical protein [uncultured Clostridium sp.]|uniref:hypothetical protein n=1 Tax=uncultured Clostridium sp. TaxID=59620 RepID=UPI0026218124|nr:hypothetical protein [uncultured Clostridium sp.]